ncbi:MAG: type II toxin-antitoxin system VapC family toxin [Candidatus Korobacteraceae bacterium]
MMSSLVVLDTSIFIDYLRQARHQHRLEALTAIVRTSAVVLAELWRGATRPHERKFLTQLEANHPVLVPTQNNWIESGQILASLRAKHGFLPAKLRDLHFDVLIALTARSIGAQLITSNGTDFELIRKVRPFLLEVW